MAATTIQELIARREQIKDSKKKKYDIETSIGTVTAIMPDAALVAEALNLNTGFEINKYLVYNSIIEPNLKDGELQKAYGVLDPTDIVSAVFLPGEIAKIGDKLFNLAGYDKKITAKLHESVKN